ncbi:MAG: sensor domain-containing protein, partial [Gaiellaceae bacterium]
MTLPAFFTEPFRLRTWKQTAYALLALPLGVAWFTLFLTLGTTSLSLLIMIVGLPLLALTLWLTRLASRVQREVAGTLLGARIPGRPTVPVQAGQPWWRRILEPVLDLATWRALVYLLFLAFPIGLALFIVAVVLWSVALTTASAPTWYFFIPPEDRGDVFGTAIDAPWEWILLVAGGLLLVFLTPWIIRALVACDVLLMRALLGPTRGELERAAAK